MKKYSKIVIILLVMALVVALAGVLTACNGDEATTPTVSRYSVTFYSNYPTDAAATSTQHYRATVDSGATVSQSSVTTPTRPAGYTFMGWYADSSLTEEFTFDRAITRNINVYAKWEANGRADTSLTNAALGSLAPESEQVSTYILQYDGDGNVIVDGDGNAVLAQELKDVPTGLYEWNTVVTEVNFNFVEKGFDNFVSKDANSRATWTVYTDANCRYQASPTVQLYSGNNYYYLMVTAYDDADGTELSTSKVYRINIRKEFNATVIFQTNVLDVGNFTVRNVKTSADILNAYHASSIYEGIRNGTLNPGYEFMGWTFLASEKYNSLGFSVDQNGNALVKEDGVYYRVDESGNKIRMYKYEYSSGTSKREYAVTYLTAGKYYQTFAVYERAGAYYYENAAGREVRVTDETAIKDISVAGYYYYDSATRAYSDTAIEVTRLTDVVDENGLPMYLTGVPVGGSNGFIENNVSVQNGEITSTLPIFDTMMISARWQRNSYTITFDQSAPTAELSVNFHGAPNILTNIPYGMGSAALGNAISELSNGLVPSIDENYGTFMGWYYRDAEGNEHQMVNAALQGVNAYDIASDVTFYAKWDFSEYAVITTVFNLTGGVTAVPGTTTVQGFGEATGTCEYGGTVTLVATANPGFTFNGWRLTKSPEQYISTDSTFTYEFTYADLNSANALSFQACFTRSAIDVNIYTAMWNGINMGSVNFAGTAFENVSDSEFTAMGEYMVSYRTNKIAFGANIPLNASTPNSTYQFLGWYVFDPTADNPLADTAPGRTQISSSSSYSEYSVPSTAESVSIVALWYYRNVNITLEYNDPRTDEELAGGNKLTTNVVPSVRYNSAIGNALTVANNSYYLFYGWYFYDGDAPVFVTSGNEPLEGYETWRFTENTTLYGAWVKIVNFEVDGGVIVGLTEQGYAAAAANNGEITIPYDSTITAIGAAAFQRNNVIKKITISGNIVSIGAYAFADSGIEVIFDGQFKGLRIGTGAFRNSTMQTFAFPANTVEIAEGVLEGCSQLTSLTYPGNVTIGALFGRAAIVPQGFYAAVQGGVSYIVPETLTEVTINNLTGVLVANAFANTRVQMVHLGTATIIGEYAFANVVTEGFRVEGLSAPTEQSPAPNSLDNVTTIGSYAFRNSSIAAVTFSSNLSSMGNGVFEGSAVAAVNFENVNIDTMPAYTFRGCVNLLNIGLNGIRYINGSAFEGCTALNTIADAGLGNIISIGSRAFYGSGFTAEHANRFTGVNTVGINAFHQSAWFNAIETSGTGNMIIGNVFYYYKGGNISSNSTVRTIASYAFKGNNLTTTEVNLASIFTALTKIDNHAFDSSNITSITTPASLTTIGSYAFNNCTSLTTVNLSNSTNLNYIGNYAFSKAGLTSVTFATGSAGNYDNLAFVIIGDYAFAETQLATINLPVKLEYLGKYAFYNCGNLLSVEFANNRLFESTTTGEEGGETTVDPELSPGGMLTRIEAGTFMDTALVAITLPYFITSIGESAFENCTALRSIVTQLETTESNTTMLTTFGARAFFNNTALSSIQFNNANAASLGVSTFENCTSLTEISMGRLTSVPARAFFGCTNLVTFGGSATINTINESAFENCSSLTKVVSLIGDIAAKAFKNCSSLASIDYLGGVSDGMLGTEAFLNCLSLNSMTIPGTIAVIGDSAFLGCNNLHTLDFSIAANLIEIGDHAFDGCSGIESISLPASVEIIGDRAFANCNDLGTVTLVGEVESIGEGAFENCANLTSVSIISDIVPVIGTNVFNGCVANFEIHVLMGFKEDFLAVDGWNDYADRIFEDIIL